jgi:Uncharacterised nucleotidyltransferase
MLTSVQKPHKIQNCGLPHLEMKPIDSKRNSPLNFNSISLELRLLLSCLRASVGQDERDRINTLTRMAIDWDVFIGLVDRHRTSSPAYRSLNRFAANNIPEPVLNRLRERFHRNTQQVLLKTAELVRIVKRFEQNHIRILPIKGPVVALQAYDDLGSRHVGDLDIMVPPESVKMAEDVLVQQSYKRTHPDFHLTRKQHSIYLRNIHHFGYFCQERGVRVELHWRFGSNRCLFPLMFNDLWKDKQTIRIGGSEMATLSPEHTILFLCAHGAEHAWVRLFWLNDIACLMKKHDTINWQSLMLHASRLGIGRMAAEGIVLSNLLLASPLPEPIRAFSEKDRSVYRLTGRAFYLIKHPEGLSPKPFTKPYYFSKMHKAMLRGDPRYKLIFGANLIGADYGDWNRVPLPDVLFPFYYLIRPFTWFSRYYVRGSKVYKEGPMGQGKNGAT